MRRIFSKIFVFFFIFLLFFIFYQFQSRAFAGYTITADPEPTPEQPTTDEAHAYIYGDDENIDGLQPQAVVTENTKTVHIKFTGLVPRKEYTVCLSIICLQDGSGNPQGGIGPVGIIGGGVGTGGGVTPTGGNERNAEDDGTLTLDVCAAGEGLLKFAPSAGCEDESGDDNGDYFGGGLVYAAVLSANIDDKPIRVAAAAFYVSRYYPKVTVTPQKLTPHDEINVTITGTRRPHGKDNRNNYAVEIARMDNPGELYSQDCITVPDDPPVTLDEREEGDYIIKINEQGNVGGLFRDDCAAEFTYYWIKIQVRSESFWNKNDSKKSVIEIIPDPNGQDMAGLTSKKKAPPPPCASAFLSTADNCPKVKTGLGIDIETSPEGFVKSIFGLILSISGGIALLLIIYSGYKLMAARGEPEALKDARDQLIAAIVGLVFIIFSLVILQIIGVDVLKIPGFGN